MIQVTFDPKRLNGQQLLWWNAWQARAKEATDDAVLAWETWRSSYTAGKGATAKFQYTFDKEIWSDLKTWLLDNVFHNKCAYCETPVGRSQFHAEHFRPKGQVKANSKVVKIQTASGQQADHPGYFWLAYHWENLLPACALCNTVQGKKNQFPVSQTYVSIWQTLAPGQVRKLKQKMIKSMQLKSVYYLQPGDLDQFEGRLLLHPYLDNPREHLVFGDNGTVAPVQGSLLGKNSIEVYDLDNGPLNDMRYEAQDKALTKFMLAFTSTVGTIAEKISAGEVAIARFKRGQEPYSAAALDYVDLVRQRLGMPATGKGGPPPRAQPK